MLSKYVKTVNVRTRNLPPVAPLQQWVWPQKPWVCLYADYTGPFLGQMFFILVDAHSKLMEVKQTNSLTMYCIHYSTPLINLQHMGHQRW